MKNNELKKELLVNYFKALKSNGNDADLLFNIIEDACGSKAWDDLDYSRIHRMFYFDDVFKDYPPHAIADMTNGKDLDKEYFVHGGFYAPGFKTFNYDEVDKVFPFAKIADAIINDTDAHSDNPVVETILYLDVETLRADVLEIVRSYCTNDDFIVTFSNCMTESFECALQIFPMDELEDVWFNILGDNFLDSLKELYASNEFNPNDLYWELIGGATKIHSFNRIEESRNYLEYEADFADELVLDTQNWFNLPNDVYEKIEELLINYGI